MGWADAPIVGSYPNASKDASMALGSLDKNDQGFDATVDAKGNITKTTLHGGWKDAPIVNSNSEIPGPDGKPASANIPSNLDVKPAPTLGDKWKGANETLTSLLTAVPAQVAGGIAGLFHAVTHPETFGTDQGAADAAKHAAEVAAKLTYTPKTETGQNMLSSVGSALDESKIAGLNPATALPAMPGAARAATQGVKNAATDVASAATSVLPKTEMAGVGAAETAAATLRRERAASLDVPIDLTKGQAERTFEQQKLERETAKMEVGAPLRERYADQNAKILQNFDSWIDQTGAEAPTLRATGAIVDKALVDKANMVKGKINQAYDAAEKAGELAQPVPTDALVSYLNENRPAAINAPVLATAEQKLLQLGGATKGEDGNLVPGQLPVNNMEELRKLIGKTSGTDPTNIHFGSEAKNVIDTATQGAGGDLYNRARLLRTQYATEFENKGVIDRLMSQKPGTTDRAVALEDVFGHSILNGSLDDVRAVRKTLQTSGDTGSQAWKELQGQTIQYLKDQSTKGVALDSAGNRVVSPAALDRAVKDLDKTGKLDFIFGKQGADKIRTINETAKDVYTAPVGSVNSSNTSSAILEALGGALTGRIPTVVGKAVAIGKSALQTRKTAAQIRDALQTPELTPIQQKRRDLGYKD